MIENQTTARALTATTVVMVSVFDMASLFAISRTKRTPLNGRFLSIGLTVFDWITLVGLASRQWIDDFITKQFVERITFAFVILSYNTVTLMTVERVLLLTNANCFLRFFHANNCRRISVAVWALLLVGTVLVRVVVCTGIHGELLTTEPCYQSSSYIYASTTAVSIVLSTGFCLKLYVLIRSKRLSRDRVRPLQKATISSALSTVHNRDLAINDASIVIDDNNDPRNVGQNQATELSCSSVSSNNENICTQFRPVLNGDRSFYLILTYLVAMFLGVIALVSFLATGYAGDRFFSAMFMLSVFNCVVNPCLYVFWYRECRMELLKICVGCVPKLQSKVESMRIEIFDIVTAVNRPKESAG